MVELRAKTQYEAWIGTAAGDDADFESIASIFGLSEKWNVLGFSIHTTHPLLNGPTAATEAYMSLTIWAETIDSRQDLKNGTLHVTEFSVQDDSPASIGQPADAQNSLDLVVRALKRTAITFWHPQIANSDRSNEDFTVDEERTLVLANGAWEELTE